MIDIHLMDEWGGIDKKIKSSVLGLNTWGIETTGSCEGDKAPCPWIMVQSSSQSVKDKFSRLLKQFYSIKNVSNDVRIKTLAVGSRFYIFSGERKTFVAWRKLVNTVARMLEQSKESPPAQTQKSPVRYQKEFIRFGEFLLATKEN